MKKSVAGRGAGRGGTWSGCGNPRAAGFRGRGGGAGTHPARSGGAWRPPTRGPERGSKRPASVAGSAAGTRRAVRPPPPRSPRPLRPPLVGTRTRLGRGDTGGVGPRRPHPPRPAAPRLAHRGSLTFHRLRLRVVVGEPGPQAEAGAVGAGPNPGVGEGQRRPAGGAVQAGHGAPGGRELGGEGGRRVGPGRPTPPSCRPRGKPNSGPGSAGLSRRLPPDRQVARGGKRGMA